MRYEVKLNPNNLQAHLEIEKDIQRIRNGSMNIVLKVNRELISDYVIYESETTTEPTITPLD